MLAVVIVTYNSSDVIVPCLESLIKSKDEILKILIVDNASTDATIHKIREWSSTKSITYDERSNKVDSLIEADCTLLRLSVNCGFAGAVNQGLTSQMRDPKCDIFWILNPDCEVEVETASAFKKCARSTEQFSFMGSRILYRETPGLIQSDGGRVGYWTGICRNVNQGSNPEIAIRPDPTTLDFISGASLVVSRKLIETIGLMREDYFLYFEEVEWASRRGDLPLVLCEDALVHHHGGTAIGSGSVTRLASPLALYFNYRNRIRFIGGVRPIALPISLMASAARIGKIFSKGAWPEAWAGLLGLCQLPPPNSVRSAISEDAAKFAFTYRQHTSSNSNKT
ncbi:glycosyltransferase family 2 protein [Roseovarius sp. S1116L3]|uniref:glycosyltransferase family 2 protein n=1 Tax=Roseovarius roseus TaxID=3342636 RepID=UPI003727B951